LSELEWYEATSADDLHPDEEVDLAKIGNPGGGEWAYVADDSGGWAWGVLDRWLWDDASYLAQGKEATKEAAKAAVERWVKTKERPTGRVSSVVEIDEPFETRAERAAIAAAEQGLKELKSALSAGDYGLAKGLFEAAARWAERLQEHKEAEHSSVTITRLED
jgi:hypothetical protein